MTSVSRPKIRAQLPACEGHPAAAISFLIVSASAVGLAETLLRGKFAQADTPTTESRHDDPGRRSTALDGESGPLTARTRMIAAVSVPCPVVHGYNGGVPEANRPPGGHLRRGGTRCRLPAGTLGFTRDSAGGSGAEWKRPWRVSWVPGAPMSADAKPLGSLVTRGQIAQGGKHDHFQPTGTTSPLGRDHAVWLRGIGIAGH
jgi:hypothetical protein